MNRLDLNCNNYHGLKANQDYMSASQFKQFQACEAMAMAEIRGEYCRPQTTAMLVGSYVDAYFTGDLEDFIENHPEIMSTRGATAGRLKAEFRQAEDIIDRLMADQVFMAFMEGKPQQIVTGEIAGVPFRAMVDVLHRDRIVDLKIMRDFLDLWSDTDGRRVSWIRNWGYDYSAAIYRELVRQQTGRTLPFYLAAGTKETVTDLAVIELAGHVLDTRLAEIEALAPGYQAIKLGLVEPVRCERCDYCKATKVLTETTLYEGE